MIQRIQSVYLLGASVLLLLAASMLYAMSDAVLGGYRLILVAALTVIGLAGFASIFLFRKRELQSTIVNTIAGIDALLVVAMLVVLYLTEDLAKALAGGPFAVVTALLVIPLVALMLFYKAGKAIQRDVDLIRSMDRLR